MNLVLVLLALVGHAVLLVAFVNRIHATALTRSLVHVLSLIAFVAIATIPVAAGVWLAWRGWTLLGPNDWLALPAAALFYLGLCWAAGATGIVQWAWRRARRRHPAVLRRHQSRSIRLASPRGKTASRDHVHHFLAHMPGNEVLDLDFAERSLAVPRLDAALDGLSIVHLSDLHFTGRIGKAFFQDVVALSNEQEPDLVAITGDLVDGAAYIDWMPDTLGRLNSRHGVFFVLGNHDLKVDTRRLRRTLVDAGLVDLGGCWTRIEVRGSPIVLAGNELPWIPPAADMGNAPPRGPDGQPLRILLSHSPDQIDWAVAHDFDLMLAGHLHGGQIRLPVLGPILSPSRWGVRFASGTFHREPTILHVSRGLSGKWPLRLNCPPELTRLVLHSP
ncbi:MAG: metallophosphoesterase [Planctomycetia bacterium]|nr:metallophosphoesterase [Planctomycetia bacterium]